MTSDTPAPPPRPRRAPAWILTGLLGLSVAGAIGWFAMPGGSGGAAGPTDPTIASLDFTVKDIDGRDVRLADYKGRPLILNFWATYCGPCKTEIPLFVELVEKYRDRNLAILGISVDDSVEDLRPFAAEYKMNYPVLVGLGHDDLLDRYEAGFLIPITWFIKADGTIHLKHPGGPPPTDPKGWLERQIQALLPAGADRP
jgi:cytochrome c biogenesis protein CcmG/thiol:disulfide interchange protein DsbE